LKEVAVHLDELSVMDSDGRRKLPLSSSPEINDNRIDAWFERTTNFDLALIRWTFEKAAELATELRLNEEAAEWESLLSEWPALSLSEEDRRLLVAPGYPLPFSHRHFSHLMAIHPLGLIDPENGPEDRKTIRESFAELDRLGPDWWVGYSYSWLGAMKARARDGAGAVQALKTFSECFCLPNSFHVNGDQTRSGKSRFTYRPFTLEGNFAFAAAIHEMLLQSHTGIIRCFPAVPDSWKEVSFRTLRAEGAFLVSAWKRRGRVEKVIIESERGGLLRVSNPFGRHGYRISGIPGEVVEEKEGVISIPSMPGDRIIFESVLR
jgi:alpha-L-fucosidase 2